MIHLHLIEIIRKLNGPIEPLGDAADDWNRYQNMEDLAVVIDALVDDMCEVSACRYAQEASLRKAGERAHLLLSDVAETLVEFLGKQEEG